MNRLICTELRNRNELEIIDSEWKLMGWKETTIIPDTIAHEIMNMQ